MRSPYLMHCGCALSDTHTTNLVSNEKCLVFIRNNKKDLKQFTEFDYRNIFLITHKILKI